jgi:hypothetical protein
MIGMQGMHSSASEVRALVDALADLYARSDVQFLSSYDASTVLYSMQGILLDLVCLFSHVILPGSIFFTYAYRE